MTKVDHRFYASMGMVPCPVEPRGKRPLFTNWQNTALEQAEAQFKANPGCNIGVLTGDSSGGLCDVDIDDSTAQEVASVFFPKTGMIFGHGCRSKSHMLYVCDSPGPTKRFVNPETKQTIIELRGNGGQTVVPGSTHISGEPIEFDGVVGPAAHVAWGDLLQMCALTAALVAAGHAYKDGCRHELVLGLCGFLAHSNVSEEHARLFVRTLAMLNQDPEAEDRLTCVRTSYDRHRRGLHLEFRSSLSRILGVRTYDVIASWFGTQLNSSLQSGSGVRWDQVSTDVGAAEAFTASRGGTMIYDEANSRWLIGIDGVYETVGCEAVKAEVIAFGKEMVASASTPSEIPIALRFLSSGKIRAIIDNSKALLNASPALFDSNPFCAGVSGGVLDIDQGCLVKPDSVVTKRLGTKFDADAECPDFKQFLGQIFNHEQDVIEFIQRAVGYTLTGSTAEQCLFVLIGGGANGKSTFVNVIQRLMGDYAGTVPMHTLMMSRYGNERTDDLASLKGLRFVAAQEGEEGQKLAEAKIKYMTGGDPITCRRLYSAYETYTPHFKLWIATNELPAITGTGDAIWRRLQVVNFPVTFSAAERDPSLPGKLVAELPGILNWALRGYAEWQRIGLAPPESVVRATSAYRGESDTVAQFLEASCVRDAGAKASVRELFEAYTLWCDCSGVESLPVGRFGKELSRLGFETVRGRSGNSKKGLRLVD